jgi:predicted MFS family arabinose efflux permease
MRSTRTTLTVIFLYNLLMVIGFGVWQALFNNFAVEELGVNASQIGLIQAIREIPGLIGFVVGTLALFVSELRISGISVVVLGAGIALTAFANDLVSLIVITFLMSTGFHFHVPANSSAVLITVGPREAPRVLGRMNSVGAVGSVAATLIILATLNVLGYRTLFLVAGLVTLVGGAILLPIGRQPVHGGGARHRAPLRRRYWLYYLLEFLMGSRRHMFTTFAIFLLVRTYRVTPHTITLLYLINSLIGTYFNTVLGRSIIRFGERKVLVLNFILLAFVFALYAIVPGWRALAGPTFQVPGLAIGDWVLFPAFPATPGLAILLGLFVVDNLLFSFSIALQCYFQKIALGPEEITANISLGQAINHIAALVVPVAGGLVWDSLGSQYTFLAGVGIALIGLLLANWIRAPRAEVCPLPALEG